LLARLLLLLLLLLCLVLPWQVPPGLCLHHLNSTAAQRLRLAGVI